MPSNLVDYQIVYAQSSKFINFIANKTIIMVKKLIATLVTALILFVWQFLSWSMLNIHGSQMAYTPQQDEILEFLENSEIQEGSYFLPTVPKGASAEDMQALQENAVGKPWARIQYNNSFNASMGMNLLRGFVINVIAAYLLIWIFLKIPRITMGNIISMCIAIGLIGYLTISYLNSVWFEGNSLPDLIDAIVPWSLVGVWLGWYLNRE